MGRLPLPDHQGWQRRSDSIRATGLNTGDRLLGMVEAFGKLPTQSAILDGELVLIDPRGAAHFYRLMAQMRTSEPDESQLMFSAFDLLHQDGVDLRGLPLAERRLDLERLSRKAKAPYLPNRDVPRWRGFVRILQ